MEVSNKGASLYHRFQASYSRSGNVELRYTAGAGQAAIRDSWSRYQASLALATSQHSPQGNSYRVDIDDEVTAHELVRPDDSRQGLLLCRNADATADGRYFEDFFANILLQQLQMPDTRYHRQVSTSKKTKIITDRIVELFDTRLRYAGPDDQWHITGKAYFRERVHHFTSRNARIHLCLPAFPCKSSNPDKVAGDMPDRGEEMGLTTLHRFVQAIGEIYAPGAKIWIISDGHVFSDCSEWFLRQSS
jgi:hypothetical protein